MQPVERPYIAAAELTEPEDFQLLPLLADSIRRRLSPGCFHYGLGGGTGQTRFSLAQLAWQERLLGQLATSLDEHSRVLIQGPSAAALGDRLLAHSPSLPASHLQAVASHEVAEDSGSETRQQFDLIIIEGSYRYLAQLSLLQACRDQLKATGQLLLASEFLVDDSQIERSSLPTLSSFRNLAARLGLLVKLDSDLSAEVLSGIEQLTSELSADSAASDFNQQLAGIAEDFRIGRRGYRLLSLVREMETAKLFPNACFKVKGEFAHQELTAVFKASFGVDFDPQLWRWKYDLGGGRCVAASLSPGGPIVAHYGGAPRHIQYFGKPAMAIQVGDVMAMPEVRKYYGKKSLFFRTGATFLEREIGNTVSHLLGFGFPNAKAMRLALRLGLYEKTDDFKELVLSPQAIAGWQLDPLPAGWLQQSVEPQQLWEAMLPAFDEAIIGLRDTAYLDYRYCQHPSAGRGVYQAFLIRGPDSKAVALLLTREHGGAQLVLDCLAQLSDLPDALRLFALWAQREKSMASKFWLTKGWLDRLAMTDCVEQDLNIEIPCNAWNRGPDAKLLYSKWWLTAGDMDFM